MINPTFRQQEGCKLTVIFHASCIVHNIYNPVTLSSSKSECGMSEDARAEDLEKESREATASLF